MDTPRTPSLLASPTRHGLRPLAAVVLAAACAAGLAGCSATEVDDDGRWVGGVEIMTAWADAEIPADWDRAEQAVTYEDLISDLDEDTGLDRTRLDLEYRGVSKEEFARFGEDVLDIDRELECEPYDPSFAQPEEEPYVETCFLDRFQGQAPLPDQFDVFAAWTGYPDGSSTTSLFLTNDPSLTW